MVQLDKYTKKKGWRKYKSYFHTLADVRSKIATETKGGSINNIKKIPKKNIPRISLISKANDLLQNSWLVHYWISSDDEEFQINWWSLYYNEN